MAHFLQIAGAALALPVLGQLLAKTQTLKVVAELLLVTMLIQNLPQAKGFFYVESHKDITKADLKTDRSGVKFEQQTCSNCALFNNESCPLFAGKKVKATAWCNLGLKNSLSHIIETRIRSLKIPTLGRDFFYDEIL